MQPHSLIDKLKQRRIVQWSLGYIAAAWVAAQVAELLAHPWGIPPGWIRVLHVFLVAGLPITVILSWYHGERGQQRASGFEVGAIVALLLVAGVGAMSIGPGGRTASEATPLGNSLSTGGASLPRLAVLAFTNVGSPQDGFFADGITAELNSRLSGLRSLAVLSRSSANMYRHSNRTLQQIGRALGADFVLSGTVRWDRNGGGPGTVRVTPEIIRIADDTQIWSSQIDRKFEDSLSVQAEIALEVTSELDLALSEPERTAISAPPTGNALAYEAYLKGIQVLPQGHGSEQDFRKALTLLEQAMTLDPDFALACVKLADANMGLYWFGYDTSEGRLETALELIERAQALAPHLPEARIARGDHYYRLRDFDSALTEFSAVREARPNDSEVLKRVGYIWRRQALFEQAADALHRASDLDPLNAYDMLEVAWTYIYLGKYDLAEAMIRKAESTDPTEEWAYLAGAIMYWSRGRDGDLEKARDVLSHFPDPRSAYPAMSWILQHLYEGDPQAALKRVRNLAVPALVLQAVYMPADLLEGTILRMLGQEQQAAAAIEKAIIHLEPERQNNPKDFRYPLALGLAYASLGRREDALREAARAGDVMPYSEDALLATDVMYAQMEIYATLGETEMALDTMATLTSVPTHFRGLYFTRNPVFAELREQPRFRELLED